jgi:hypothetical protein
MVAAMVNVSGKRRTTAASELSAIYANRGDIKRITDIKLGTAGNNKTAVGYDNVTGVGVPAGVDFDADPAQAATSP